MTMLMLKRSYQLISSDKRSELRDSARNNMVVFRGTYAVREAKRLGLWY